ncbi:MAG: hypothetical protein EGQ64_03275 [Ruminococcaceae bacterium]|nr:hypothetical protein [Oscillospiraceae bacterium]
MIIFKKMFAEKILRFHEAMNRFSELLMRMPHLGDKIRNQIEENDNYRLKMTFGVIAQIGIVLFELLQSAARVDSNSCGAVAEDSAKTAQCNSDDRCQRQKQGGAVGAAASRMRVPPKARRSRWEPRPGFLFILRGLRHPPAPTKKPQRMKIR